MNHKTDYQVTSWGHPYEMIESSFGALSSRTHAKIAYQHYLQLELTRWYEKNGRDAWIECNSEGLVALFSRREYMQAVEAEE